jgi:hypothetical protein
MGDDVAKALDRLADLLSAKTTDAATVAAKAAEGTPLSTVRVHKLEWTPNEVKLEGVSNYLSWYRRGLLLLKMKALQGYVLGEVNEPEERKRAE